MIIIVERRRQRLFLQTKGRNRNGRLPPLVSSYLGRIPSNAYFLSSLWIHSTRALRATFSLAFLLRLFSASLLLLSTVPFCAMNIPCWPVSGRSAFRCRQNLSRISSIGCTRKEIAKTFFGILKSLGSWCLKRNWRATKLKFCPCSSVSFCTIFVYTILILSDFFGWLFSTCFQHDLFKVTRRF